MTPRYLQAPILEDLRKKMVFVGGPRQAGKTTLIKQILSSYKYRRGNSGLYLNWDSDEDRADILKKRWASEHELLAFDELHKFPRWKNWLKGLFDAEREQHRMIVTGSARLDVYRRGGDSLLGRYHYWRLHPFTLSELPRGLAAKTALARLMSVGGFPEPFLDGNERSAKRWRRDRTDRVIKDDVRDLESVREIRSLGMFRDLLTERVGQLTVLSNLAGDLQIAPKTAATWLEVLERMYLCFAVRPYTKNLPRAVQKPPKVYFFDNADVPEHQVDGLGPRFENLVATHLLKRLHYLEDFYGQRCDLRYLRDKEGREVDFVVLIDGKVEELIEVKYADSDISRALKYYNALLKPKRAIQIVAELRRPYTKDGIHVMGPVEALSQP